MSALVEPQKKNALEHGSPTGKRQWQGSSSRNARRCDGGIEASSEPRASREGIVLCVVTVLGRGCPECPASLTGTACRGWRRVRCQERGRIAWLSGPGRAGGTERRPDRRSSASFPSSAILPASLTAPSSALGLQAFCGRAGHSPLTVPASSWSSLRAPKRGRASYIARRHHR